MDHTDSDGADFSFGLHAVQVLRTKKNSNQIKEKMTQLRLNFVHKNNNLYCAIPIAHYGMILITGHIYLIQSIWPQCQLNGQSVN